MATFLIINTEMVKLEEIYDKTMQGFQIIKDLAPEASIGLASPKKAFKYRQEEKTPSAYLLAPSNQCPYYSIVDYGISSTPMSPIDLYMREKGYGQHQFHQAVLELAEKYGVEDDFVRSAHKPIINMRELKEGDVPGTRTFVAKEGFTTSELRTWGPCVKPEHLTELGWKAAESVTIVTPSKVVETRSTEDFPIFVQECPYIDAAGNEKKFYKVYKPLEKEKRYRFLYIGEVQKDYVFGLDALKRAYRLNGEIRIKRAVLVSGGSDAVNCLSMGEHPVWLNSETADLTEEVKNSFYKYAEEIVAIPDLDTTGVIMGRRLALRHLDIKVAWLPIGLMSSLKDMRGRKRKDLKDFVEMMPNKAQFNKIIKQAMKAQFWDIVKDKESEKTDIIISRVRLYNFLELNGFYVLHEDDKPTPRYIHIDGIKVKDVKASDITDFLKNWMHDEGLPESIRNKVLRCRDLPNRNTSNFTEKTLDFSSGTRTSQTFYFQNCYVTVTADAITRHLYTDMGEMEHFVWVNDIIKHNYTEMPDMFTIVDEGEGHYSISINGELKSELFGFLINSSRLYWREELELPFMNVDGSFDEDAKNEYFARHRFCIDGENLTEEQVRDQMQCLVAKIANIGYHLHRFKSESRAWATFCFDNTLGANDECNGRTGKSFYLKMLRSIIRGFFIDARRPSVVENRFIFDGVTEYTDVICVDECAKDLPFDFFLGKITGKLKGEEKGNHPYEIEFSKSPKFIFASNYVFKKMDASTQARLWQQVFSDYYHQQSKSNDYLESRSIYDDFGHNLIDGEYQGWDADIAFLMQCEKIYLKLIEKNERILPPLDNIDRRELRAKIGKSFEEWAEDYFSEGSGHLDTWLKQDTVYQDFCSEVNFKNYSKNSFTNQLKSYCEYAKHIKCYNPASETGNVKDGERCRKMENGKRIPYIYIESVAAHNNKTNEPIQTEMPF